MTWKIPRVTIVHDIFKNSIQNKLLLLINKGLKKFDEKIIEKKIQIFEMDILLLEYLYGQQVRWLWVGA